MAFTTKQKLQKIRNFRVIPNGIITLNHCYSSTWPNFLSGDALNKQEQGINGCNKVINLTAEYKDLILTASEARSKFPMTGTNKNMINTLHYLPRTCNHPL